MNAYRAATAALGLAYVMIAGALVAERRPPGPERLAQVTEVLGAPWCWALAFGTLGLVLTASALVWRPFPAMVAHIGLFATSATLAFGATVLAIFRPSAPFAAAAVTIALASAHMVILLCGPPLRRP